MLLFSMANVLSFEMCENLVSPIYAYRPIKGNWQNSVDPDQMLQDVASDQNLHVCIKYKNLNKTW